MASPTCYKGTVPQAQIGQLLGGEAGFKFIRPIDSDLALSSWRERLVPQISSNTPSQSQQMVEYTEDDPKPQLEDACKVECLKEWHQYKECAKRIEHSDHEGAHCTGWAFDYWRCVDKCVAPKLFQKLK